MFFRYLLTDTDVALANEDASVMDRFGQSKLKDLQKQAINFRLKLSLR